MRKTDRSLSPSVRCRIGPSIGGVIRQRACRRRHAHSRFKPGQRVACNVGGPAASWPVEAAESPGPALHDSYPRPMAYSADAARQEMLDEIATAIDGIAAALAALGTAYEQLTTAPADRL